MRINSIQTSNPNFGAYFVTEDPGREDVRYVRGINPGLMEHIKKAGLEDEFEAAESKLAKLGNIPLCADSYCPTDRVSTWTIDALSRRNIFLEEIAKLKDCSSKNCAKKLIKAINSICENTTEEHSNFVSYLNETGKSRNKRFNEALERDGYVNVE